MGIAPIWIELRRGAFFPPVTKGRPMKSRKRASRSSRAAASLGGNLMLAPAVIAMRLPLMAAEAGRHGWPAETAGALTEKMAAAAEGLAAAQMSIMMSASGFWLEIMSGKTPSLLDGAAMERAAHAALAPSGRAVRSNFGRLARKSR